MWLLSLLFVGSTEPSSAFRLRGLGVGVLSASEETAGFASSVAALAVAGIEAGSSSGELGVFEEECFLWWTRTEAGPLMPAFTAWEEQARAEHDRHVHVLLRASSLEHVFSISSLQDHEGRSFWKGGIEMSAEVEWFVQRTAGKFS